MEKYFNGIKINPAPHIESMKELWAYGHTPVAIKPSFKVVQSALSALKQTTGLDLCYEGAFQLSLPLDIETS